MRISIIIPVLNEAEGIVQALHALQIYRDLGHELILVDGGSTDATVELALDHVDRLVCSEPGRAIQMQRGAAEAAGDVFWFLHADTQISTSAFEALLRAATAARPTPYWGHFDVEISGLHRFLPVIAWFMNIRSRLSRVVTGDQGMFVDRVLFQETGGFKQLALMEDIEYSKRLRQISPPLCLAGPLITSGRRWEQKGVLRTICLMWLLRLAYFLGVSPKRLADWYYPGQQSS